MCSCAHDGFICLSLCVSVLGYPSVCMSAFLSLFFLNILKEHFLRENREEIQLGYSITYPPKVNKNKRKKEKPKAKEVQKISRDFLLLCISEIMTCLKHHGLRTEVSSSTLSHIKCNGKEIPSKMHAFFSNHYPILCLSFSHLFSYSTTTTTTTTSFLLF